MQTSGDVPSEGLSRRGLVQALVLGGAVAGAAAAGRASASGPTPDHLVLRSRDLRATRAGSEAGKLPDAGSVPATHGSLDLGDGDPGRFDSTSVPGSGGRFVMHSFDLGDGLLLGMGSGPLRDGAFAVVGGTGRYAGATGAYTARQSPRDLGGDGSAEFVFDLTGRES
ncbi:MAG: hypothetical protein JWN17_610 [Frankiales bacterium]|nr:hypothetical protein [Frankiales bacterium]